jgi:hypothetical protein
VADDAKAGDNYPTMRQTVLILAWVFLAWPLRRQRAPGAAEDAKAGDNYCTVPSKEKDWYTVSCSDF